MVKRIIRESDFEKARRLRAGYTQVVEIEPKRFISNWEATHGKRQEQDFAWNQERLQSALARESDDSYPRVTSIRDVEDGWHRIAAAAEKGENVEVTIQDTDDPSKFWLHREKKWGLKKSIW